jgi:HD-GYP domain-containing protein (c-di-GMP phosphodiesterase class II)
MGQMSQRTVSITINELRLGVTCSHPVEDDHGVLLLGANTRITDQVINGLRDRGIKMIEVDSRDLAAMRGGGKKKAATRRTRNDQDGWPKSKPVKDMLVDRYAENLCEERNEHLQNSMQVAKGRFEQLRQQIAENAILSVGEFRDLSDIYARSMVDDHDQTVGVVGTLSKICEPEERAVRMSVLGMAIAIEMGLDGQQTLEVGMTALLHDIGIYAMDPRLHKRVELMDESEHWEYRKHPLVSVHCISGVREVPESVPLAMQQVHEQFDGSGYPRGVKGQRIHSYARILNVVDAYLQLTGATADRHAIVPHDAFGLMLHQSGRGIFDPKVMRAFLNVETMFPLGSLVELNSGELARVIRRPRTGFARPVLQGLDGNRIELECNRLEVVRPVCDPEVEQIRLHPDQMRRSAWHPCSHHALVV